MKKPHVIAIGSSLLLAIIVVLAFLRSPSLHSSARREWKEKSISEVAGRVADPSWPSNEFSRLRLQSANEPSDYASWLSDRIIMTRKGEWLA